MEQKGVEIMQTKLPDGSVMVCGGCSKDAHLEYVGQDNKRLCKVGLAVGKRPVQGDERPETIWCNVVAWHKVAQVLSEARKGDAVFAIGRLQSRDYEGKTYTDLVAEYIDICAPRSSSSGCSSTSASYPAQSVLDREFSELTSDDGSLPF